LKLNVVVKQNFSLPTSLKTVFQEVKKGFVKHVSVTYNLNGPLDLCIKYKLKKWANRITISLGQAKHFSASRQQENEKE
jgi:hypothetical protein